MSFTIDAFWGRLLVLLQRYPRSLALFGFASGLASFFLVERQQGLVRVIALAMLASWVFLLLERVLRLWFARRFGRRLPPALLRFITQMVHQESLFFVLPLFVLTTSWLSPAALFSALLMLAAMVAIIDPLYYRGLATRRWLFLAFHSLTLFAVLLVALPLIWQLSTAQSYRLALGLSALLLLPAFWEMLPGSRWERGSAALVLAGLCLWGGWAARGLVPPATLWLAEGVFSQELDSRRRSPGPALEQLSEAQLRAQGLYAFTAISAPRGLHERIYHVWRHESGWEERIALDIRGGRQQGYRAWTHKQNFPAQAAGRWQLRVETETGQLLGLLRLQITAVPPAQPLPPGPAAH